MEHTKISEQFDILTWIPSVHCSLLSQFGGDNGMENLEEKF